MATEKRLIDKKSAWKMAQRIYSDPVLLHAIKNTLDNVPTVDAVEVVHGRWVKRGNETKCSVCKFIYYSNKDNFNYCPNCGADMSGDGNG